MRGTQTPRLFQKSGHLGKVAPGAPRQSAEKVTCLQLEAGTPTAVQGWRKAGCVCAGSGGLAGAPLPSHSVRESGIPIYGLWI